MRGRVGVSCPPSQNHHIMVTHIWTNNVSHSCRPAARRRSPEKIRKRLMTQPRTSVMTTTSSPGQARGVAMAVSPFVTFRVCFCVFLKRAPFSHFNHHMLEFARRFRATVMLRKIKRLTSHRSPFVNVALLSDGMPSRLNYYTSHSSVCWGIFSCFQLIARMGGAPSTSA